jgi:hypothetical protein
MNENKQIEPIFVVSKPEGSSLVGMVELGDHVPIDTYIEGSPESVWQNGMYQRVREGLISKATQEYTTEKAEKLFLVEGVKSRVDFHVAGIVYHVSADVYRR